MKFGEKRKLYYEHLKSKLWKDLRVRVLERDRFRCLHCRKKVEEHTCHIHHLNYTLVGQVGEINTLITLCPSCHLNLHKSEKEAKEYREIKRKLKKEGKWKKKMIEKKNDVKIKLPNHLKGNTPESQYAPW